MYLKFYAETKAVKSNIETSKVIVSQLAKEEILKNIETLCRTRGTIINDSEHQFNKFPDQQNSGIKVE